MSTGWIKLHRRLLDNPRAGDPEWLSVWVYLLLNATHQPYKMNFDGKIVELQPGQLITGRYAIAGATGVNPSKVKRILKLLKSDQQIDQQAGVKGSLFTVLNWKAHQESDQQTDQGVTSNRPATDQRLTTNKNVRTEEGEEHKKQRRTSAPGAMPELSEVEVYAQEIGLPPSEAARFIDFYAANGWRVGRNPMKNWKAALRNWKRNWADRQKPTVSRNEGTFNKGKESQYANAAR